MGGKGSGRPPKSDGSKGSYRQVNGKVQMGIYVSPQTAEKIRLGAFAAGQLKYSHYIELLVSQDKEMTLQLFANELIMIRNELDLSIKKSQLELDNQVALRDRISKLLKRLGRV